MKRGINKMSIHKDDFEEKFENTHTELTFDDNSRLVGIKQYCKAKHFKKGEIKDE